MTDPFLHHPRLRALVTPPEQSGFRNFDPAQIVEMVLENGGNTDWMLSEDERETDRRSALTGREGQDIWVFAYGSLMWDPAFHFAEVRRGFAPGVARRFILCDALGGRGTRDAPGVMAGLDPGDGCHGLVFRIAADIVETETPIMWRRERVGQAYFPRFIPVETEHGWVNALAFMANHDAELIVPDLPHEKQVQYCATGEGIFGTSFDYVANLAAHFKELGIVDEGVTRLLADAQAWRAAHTGSDSRR